MNHDEMLAKIERMKENNRKAAAAIDEMQARLQACSPGTSRQLLELLRRMLPGGRGARAEWLPIYQVRQFCSGLSRQRLDQLLFDLEDSDLIQLHALQDGHLYSAEQFDQGIPSAAGGPLFFVEVIK